MNDIVYDADADLTSSRARRSPSSGTARRATPTPSTSVTRVVEVKIGLQEGSKSRQKAEEAGFRRPHPGRGHEVGGRRRHPRSGPGPAHRLQGRHRAEPPAGATLVFGHGFNIRFGYIQAPEGVDVSLVAPKGPGHTVRREYEAGRGVPVIVAVEVDASGSAWDLAWSYSKAIGGLRSGGIKTTFTRRPRPTCSASRPSSAVAPRSSSSTASRPLVEAGYQPQIAYFEVLHELKLIVDLIWEGGLTKQRWSISDTAEFGDYVSGPRVISPDVKENMKAVLADIQNGAFAKRFIDDQDAGAPEFKALRAKGEGTRSRPRPRAPRALRVEVERRRLRGRFRGAVVFRGLDDEAAVQPAPPPRGVTRTFMQQLQYIRRRRPASLRRARRTCATLVAPVPCRVAGPHRDPWEDRRMAVTKASGPHRRRQDRAWVRGPVPGRERLRADFVDVVDRVVSALNEARALRGARGRRDAVEHLVYGFTALSSKTDRERVVQAIAEADVVTTAVGARTLPLVAPVIARGARGTSARARRRHRRGVRERLQRDRLPARQHPTRADPGGPRHRRRLRELRHRPHRPGPVRRARAVRRPRRRPRALLRVGHRAHAVRRLRHRTARDRRRHLGRTTCSRSSSGSSTPVNTAHATAAYHGYVRGIRLIREALEDAAVRAEVDGVSPRPPHSSSPSTASTRRSTRATSPRTSPASRTAPAGHHGPGRPQPAPEARPSRALRRAGRAARERGLPVDHCSAPSAWHWTSTTRTTPSR